MRSLIVMTALATVAGMGACERRMDPTPRSQTQESGATSAPKEKVVLTSEQLEEMARAKVLLALLGKDSAAEEDKGNPALQTGH